jgi:hypothetical protein
MVIHYLRFTGPAIPNFVLSTLPFIFAHGNNKKNST